jgi:hypothetical protein
MMKDRIMITVDPGPVAKTYFSSQWVLTQSLLPIIHVAGLTKTHAVLIIVGPEKRPILITVALTMIQLGSLWV